MTMAQRIPELEAPREASASPEAREGHVTASEGADKQGPLGAAGALTAPLLVASVLRLAAVNEPRWQKQLVR